MKDKEITNNQLGVLIESLGSRIGAIAEGQRIHDDKLNKIDDRFDQIDNRLDKMDNKIDTVHSSLKNEIRITALALDSKIEETKQELKEDIRRVENKLDEHIKLPVHI